MHSQTMGSVAVRTDQRLVRDSLVSVYGGKVQLAAVVALLHQ
ncbi:hypothetical protein [Streptomyces sp. NPDC058268]